MTKYKLIKEYPGSPKLGFEISERYCATIKEGNFLTPSPISWVDVINNPEFWQKIEEKDYEILSVICNQNYNDLRKGEIITKQENGQYMGKNILTWEKEDVIIKMKH